MSRGVGWWLGGIFREGIWHLLAASGMWFLFNWIFNPGIASVAVATFWIGRELRDWEVEAGPRLWRALGFNTSYPLAPARQWSLEQFRHSLSGWLPVCLAMSILYVVQVLW